jgi:hypothetical protein
LIVGPDDKPPLFSVIVEETQSTRTPDERELALILEYIRVYTLDIGMPPLADHPVEGVGLVLFCRPPSPFTDQ